MSSVKVTFDLDLLIQEINHLKYLAKNVKIYFLRKERMWAGMTIFCPKTFLTFNLLKCITELLEVFDTNYSCIFS